MDNIYNNVCYNTLSVQCVYICYVLSIHNGFTPIQHTVFTNCDTFHFQMKNVRTQTYKDSLVHEDVTYDQSTLVENFDRFGIKIDG